MENKLIFAKEIIKEAGAFIKESLSKTITVEEKTAFDDLVTNIDKQTQDLLVARIQIMLSLQTIFSLKKMALVHNIKDGNVWVLDPIDGTVNFIVQQDNFCVMIAYYEEGQGKFGLI
ncbi:MAG: inositol monophosphatase family protein [Streptococcus salivarius]